MTEKTKKEKFLQATLELVYEKGFVATSMRDIAKNAGFEVANIYNYIGSKETFLEAYIFGMITEFEGFMAQVLESTYSPKDKLQFLISKHIRFTFQRPYEVALFVYDWRNLKDPKLSDFKNFRKEYLTKFGSIIADGVAAGQFRPMNIEMATFLVFSSLRWLFNTVIHDNGEKNPIEIEKQITDFIFEGIGRGSI